MQRFETEVRTSAGALRHWTTMVVMGLVLIAMLGGLVLAFWPLLVGAFGFFFAFLALFHLWRPLQIIAIDEHGVHLNDKQVMTRNEIASAVAYEDPQGGAHVTIASAAPIWTGGGGLLDLDVSEMANARAVVRACELPADRFFRTKIVDSFTYGWMFCVSSAAGLAIDFASGGKLWWAMGICWAVLVAVHTVANQRVFVGTEYVVGSDGVRQRKFFRARFIPFSKIEKVDRGVGWERFRVRLHIGEKKPLELRGVQPHRIAQLQMKIAEGVDRYRLHAIAGHTPADLERRHRSMREWLTSLRSIGSSSTTKYRVAATSPDDLVRVLEDQSANIASRAASAIALDAIDRDAPKRIHEVAGHTANPKLRVALERIANHAEDSVIEESLDALCDGRAG